MLGNSMPKIKNMQNPIPHYFIKNINSLLSDCELYLFENEQPPGNILDLTALN